MTMDFLKTILFILMSAMFALGTGCWTMQQTVSDDDASPAGDMDGDSDGDADGDSDGDADGDADGDTDSDSDADADLCPTNSGWPCACNLAGDNCDDGSLCAGVQDMSDGVWGFCSAPCDDLESSCGDVVWDAEPWCALWDGVGYWCVLSCEIDDQCPPLMHCNFTYDSGICHP